MGFNRKGLAVWPLALALMTVLAVGQEAKKPRKPGHLFPAERVETLDSAGRDDWQKPAEVMQALGVKAGDTVADVGAGSGYLTVKLARQVGERGTVYACDIQKKLIDYIEKRVAKEDLHNVKTILGEPSDPKLPRESVDTVFIVDVYHEVSDTVRWLQNIKTSLKPDGRIAIIDFKKELKEGPGPPNKDRLPEKTVLDEAKQAGLKLVRRETFLPYQYLLIFGKS